MTDWTPSAKSKLSYEQRDMVVQMRRAGKQHKAIARALGCTPEQVKYCWYRMGYPAEIAEQQRLARNARLRARRSA
jgi:hypothetical protein